MNQSRFQSLKILFEDHPFLIVILSLSNIPFQFVGLNSDIRMWGRTSSLGEILVSQKTVTVTVK